MKKYLLGLFVAALMCGVSFAQDVRCSVNVIQNCAVVQNQVCVAPMAEETISFNFVPECAAAAAADFQNCRASGGAPLGCFFGAAVTYITCPGVITLRAMRRMRGVRRFGMRQMACR